MQNIKTAYFLGIGGIGMSAIARYFNRLGIHVHGYDRTETPLTQALVAEGMHIHYEDKPELIPANVDLVVLTPAIPKDHKEWAQFKAQGTTIMKRAEILGLISKEKRCLAVAGTHGKTSTSSLLAYLMSVGEKEPSAFLGGIAENFQSNFIQGESDLVVTEADEFDRSFLQLYPETLILTALDADHLDIYNTEQEMIGSYGQLITQIKKGGNLIIKKGLLENPFLQVEKSVLKELNIIEYGVDEGDACARNMRVEDGYMVFDYVNEIFRINGLKYTQAGRHNVENAVGAITAALQYGLMSHDVREALLTFKGIKRRFEIIARTETKVYVDDYAHHPEELRAAIAAARLLFPNRKLTGVFQPHLYTRTRDFVEGFAETLDALDEIILLDIYPARELPIEGVTSEIIFNRMQNPNKKLITKQELLHVLELYNVDVLLTLGAGDIDKFIPQIKDMVLGSN